MELNLVFYAFAIPAVLIAGIAKGGFAGGAAFIAAPLLATVIEPRYAVSLMLPLLMLMDIATLRVFWKKWDWPNARLMMAGGVVGIVLGFLLIGNTDPDVMRLLIGGIAIGFVLFQFARSRGIIDVPPRPLRTGPAVFWGSAAGFTSFISHAGGPPAAVHLLSQRITKTAYQATTVLLFWWINLVKLPFYVGLGMFTQETLIADLSLIPVALIGVRIGVWAHDKVSDRVFFGLTYVLLLATGSKLILEAVT